MTDQQFFDVNRLMGYRHCSIANITDALEMNGGNPHLAAAQLIERMAAEVAVNAQGLPQGAEKQSLRVEARQMLDEAARLRADGRRSCE